MPRESDSEEMSFCRSVVSLGRSYSRVLFQGEHCLVSVRAVRALHCGQCFSQADELRSMVPTQPSTPLAFTFSTPVYFDTHQVIRELEEAGYSVKQAETLVAILNHSLRSSVAAAAASQLSQRDLDVLELKLKGSVDAVNGAVVLLEKSTVAALRTENENLQEQISRLRAELKDEIGKVQSGVRLDLNLEKSRNTEEATFMDQKVKDTNNRIDKEVANLKTQMEAQKLESIKYLAGGIFSIVTIVLSVVLGMWRLMK